MKFIIATQEFNYLINTCLNVVPAKPTLPVLSNLLIEAVNDELIVTATDLTVGIRCFTDAKILREGSTTIPAKKLAQLMRELTAINVEVSTNENEVTEIVADSSRFKLNGMNKSEFPSLPNMAGATQITVKQNDLKDMLYRTSFAVSREDNRYALTGVHMQIAGSEAIFVGTDGKRMSRTRMPVSLEGAFSGGYIVPLKAVEEIQKNLTQDGDATLSLLHDKIAVESGNTRIITKLLSGEYPDVGRIIPEQCDVTVALHRDELMSLLRQVSLFTDDSHHSVRFSFSDGELKLSANTMEIGEGRVSMPVNYHGQKLDIAFNPAFFLDILRHTTQETVTMGVIDGYSPGVITDSEAFSKASEARSLFVLMPLRLNEG